jgi:signal transduction histidine kinase
MPIRLRITFLFTLAVFIILGIVCVAIYYFSSTSRINTIKKRLANRAITTARLLTQSEIFDRELIRRIDSSTTLTLKNKSVQAYNSAGRRIYSYNDAAGDTLSISGEIKDEARENGTLYFTEGNKEAVAYYHEDSSGGMVIVCSALDEDGKKNLVYLKNILVIGFIGGTFISFAGGYFFSRRLLLPVSKITNEVTDISVYNLTRRIQTGETKDEWYQLSTTLNELLDRLKESFELQRRFISNASHELSTPLTLISSQLEIALQRTRTDEEYRGVMSSVLQDVHNMNNLVQTLLKFATASGNSGGLNIDLVRIDEILMRLPAEIHKQERQHSISLQFNGLPEEEDKLLVFGNEELLFTAIRNIAVNACKYSPDHRAEVILNLEGEGFSIQIKDKGIGIEDKELANIFQPFYRIEQTISEKGFGLGLSLASRIIKLHKGEVTVNSVPGVGTTFTIELPAARPL